MRKLVILLWALAGCGPVVTVDDDVDIVWDFKQLVGPSSEMHTPYVLGASFNLYVESTDDKEKFQGWTVESSNPAILTVGAVQRYSDNRRIFVNAHGVGDGTAQVIVKDSGGSVQTRQSVEVRLPDRAQVMAHGLLIIGKSDAEAQVSELRLLQGGTATFLIRYYLGTRTLSGNGALGVDAPSDVTATTPHTYLFEDRDWLQVTPSMAGSSSISLKVNGVHFSDVPLTVVDSSQVNSVHIQGGDEAHAKKDDWLVALGQAFDDQMRRIYGVDFHWEVDGQLQSSWDGSDKGDLYRYQFDPAKPKMLAATYGGVSAVAMIHSGGGFVDSSNHIGCSYSPGGAAGSWGMLLLLVLFLWKRRTMTA
jgi:MYXO-CTERM domain-containing protein